MTKPSKAQPIPFPGEPGGLPFQVVAEAPWGANWPAWDVPRLADILAPEDNAMSGEQASGFRRLADLLHDHCRSLIRQRAELAAAWQGPAAEVVLQHIDTFTAQLLSDARCAAVTSSALYGIIGTHAKAKTDIAALHDQWKDVTTDWAPEWWDHAAAELNTKAVAIMDQTDKALGDHRTRITVPEAYQVNISDTPPPPQTSPTDPAQQPKKPSDTFVPPVPGYQPTANASSLDGPVLSGAPSGVPATPGQPVSMLPVPPGNPYAPYGGAYILPGPGVGRGGYVVQMPQPGRAGGIATGPSALGLGASAPGRGGASGGPGGAMMPIPMMNSSHPATSSRAGAKVAGRADTVWEVEKGIPPVIEGISQQAYIQGHPSTTQEAEFQDWFAQLAYPWRKEHSGQSREPQVILRRAKS
jgi:hypothetical protein